MENNSTEYRKTTKKRKLSKRGILFLSNGIAFAVFFVVMYFIAVVESNGEFIRCLLAFIMIQCVFTFFSLIVYYLSIIAGALDKNHNKQNNLKE